MGAANPLPGGEGEYRYFSTKARSTTKSPGMEPEMMRLMWGTGGPPKERNAEGEMGEEFGGEEPPPNPGGGEGAGGKNIRKPRI